jgi:hypothetical protein
MIDQSLKEDLIKALHVISHPRAYGLTQEELENAVTEFCARCPDPVHAYWLFAECPDQMSDEVFVERALTVPRRPMSEVPTSIIPANHSRRGAAHGA